MAKEANDNIKRFNLRMGNEVFDWYEWKAREIGVSTSNYMIMILAEHKRQVESVDIARSMPWEQIEHQIKATAAGGGSAAANR